MQKKFLFDAVLFDLDGTLFDTAPDLIAACNHTLEKFGFSAVPENILRTRVTAGMRMMMQLGVPEEQWESAGIGTVMRSEFASYYTEHINIYTVPFPGMEELVIKLTECGIKTGVVTNKYENMAKRLFSKFPFTQNFSLLLGCDSLTHAKPHPEPILKALEILGTEGGRTLYVGDHKNDILAAKAASCKNAAALWGYGGLECGDPLSWQADFNLRDPAALGALILND